MICVLAKKGEEYHTLYLNEITENKEFINFNEGNKGAETWPLGEFKAKYEVLGLMRDCKKEDIRVLKR